MCSSAGADLCQGRGGSLLAQEASDGAAGGQSVNGAARQREVRSARGRGEERGKEGAASRGMRSGRSPPVRMRLTSCSSGPGAKRDMPVPGIIHTDRARKTHAVARSTTGRGGGREAWEVDGPGGQAGLGVEYADRLGREVGGERRWAGTIAGERLTIGTSRRIPNLGFSTKSRIKGWPRVCSRGLQPGTGDTPLHAAARDARKGVVGTRAVRATRLLLGGRATRLLLGGRHQRASATSTTVRDNRPKPFCQKTHLWDVMGRNATLSVIESTVFRGFSEVFNNLSSESNPGGEFRTYQLSNSRATPLVLSGPHILTGGFSPI